MAFHFSPCCNVILKVNFFNVIFRIICFIFIIGQTIQMLVDVFSVIIYELYLLHVYRKAIFILTIILDFKTCA